VAHKRRTEAAAPSATATDVDLANAPHGLAWRGSPRAISGYITPLNAMRASHTNTTHNVASPHIAAWRFQAARNTFLAPYDNASIATHGNRLRHARHVICEAGGSAQLEPLPGSSAHSAMRQ
jgi:hypothetical protein